ncbi:MAG: hypothetical protein R2844_21875 [Caldilineales bacterium]
MKTISKVMGLLWRGVVVGVAYVLVMMLAGVVLGVLGLIPPGTGGAASSLFWTLIAAVLLGLYLGRLAAHTPATRRQHVLIWTAVIFFNMGAVVLEGAYFAPDLVPIPLPALAIQQALAALVAGGLIALMFARREETAAFLATLRGRRWFGWFWRFLAASLSYLVFYAVFGALNYSLITEPYYASHAGGLTAPAAATVLAVELVRAPLLVLSVVLLILALRTGRRRTLLVAGLTLFWVGGVVPLTLQIASLPAPLLLASAVEIFLQNFLTGAVAGWLFWTQRAAGDPITGGSGQLQPAPA